MSRLADRLARLRESGMAPKASSGASSSLPPRISGNGTLSPKRDLSPLLRRGPSEPPSRRGTAGKKGGVAPDAAPPGEGWSFVADFVWERTKIHRPVLPATLDTGFVLSEKTSSESLLFYDLETTGLSGGAGNIAFLIGLGRQGAGQFAVTQLFLTDYPGEAAMLERFRDFFVPPDSLLSYNGRSFDSQVLKTRFLLNRLPPPEWTEIDLLYPARRLWRGMLPEVSLKTLEAEVLGIHRPDDLPGSEAPEAWFQWLRGDLERIEGVFSHNLDDIISLALLLGHFEKWGAAEPGTMDPSGTPPSCRGMARQWSQSGSSKEIRWFEAGWARGNRECGRELARRMKRRGEYDGARAIWERLDVPPDRDFPAAVELAKFWEHRRRDPRRAFEVLDGLPEEEIGDTRRGELRHRRERLLRKCAG